MDKPARRFLEPGVWDLVSPHSVHACPEHNTDNPSPLERENHQVLGIHLPATNVQGAKRGLRYHVSIVL